FERGTATGSIDHVDVRAAVFESDDVAFGERTSAIHFAGVNRDRTAAALFARHDDLDARTREHAHRRFVPLGKRHVHDAAGVQEGRRLAFAACGKALIARYEKAIRHARRERFDTREAEEAQDAA